jgi:hypothetical protein
MMIFDLPNVSRNLSFVGLDLRSLHTDNKDSKEMIWHHKYIYALPLKEIYNNFLRSLRSVC